MPTPAHALPPLSTKRHRAQTLSALSLASLPPPATEILPRLFISDLHTAEDAAALRALGITHVLSALPGPVRLPPALALTRYQVPVHDTPFAELAAHLPACTAFIDAALREPGARVLVHCAMGASRSVSVVCAWLVARAGLEPDAAVRFVRERRCGADPNPGFVMQLHEYAASLRAAANANAGS
ncbi:phosphatases II [Dentipellis sp. KUC8613]|nr:phosphatases II [Dentipellis sp. KUC8613]